MGAFYVNISLRGPAHGEVFRYLLDCGRDAIVAPTSAGVTVVYDQQCDSQDMAIIHNLATELSRRFDCPALAVAVHDDDVFFYRLYSRGELLNEYDSNPSYFNAQAATDAAPAGGDAATLCRQFQCGDNAAEVERILRAPNVGCYAVATRRHKDLAKQLNLPDWSVSRGFQDLNTTPTLPEGFVDTIDGPGAIGE